MNEPTADIWNERREGWEAGKADARDAAATDYGRIVHSASFRRLQGKTQILNLGDSDFYRNRLTHSIEVAQVARTSPAVGVAALEQTRSFRSATATVRLNRKQSTEADEAADHQGAPQWSFSIVAAHPKIGHLFGRAL